MIKLSSRLAAIAELVPRGSRLADIGSDHALLPVFLVQRGLVPLAIAGELNAGPFEAAQDQVRNAGLDDRISVRRGDGLSVLAPGEVDTVTIAGMGGGLIADILEAGRQLLDGVRTLILQPNVAEDLVRKKLIELGYVLLDERILTEDGITYVILYAEQAKHATRTNEEVYRARTMPSGFHAAESDLLRFGPYLLERLEEPFLTKWQEEKMKLEAIQMRIAAQSASPQAAKRLHEIRQEIERITEVLRCSHMDRPSDS